MRTFAAEATLAPDDTDALPPLSLAEHTLQGQYRDVEVPLYNIDREAVGKFVLAGDVFDVPIRKDILHRVVRWQLARRQQGTHKTKTRSEVRGGGRKPWKQKGSGRARQGTIRAPQWRGGGVVHGPVPRSHEIGLQKRVRRLGLACALSAKAWERRLTVVDSLRPEDHRTKTIDGHVDALLAGAPRRSALLVDSDKEGPDGG
jgi:large subunit ribosomal protein L4